MNSESNRLRSFRDWPADSPIECFRIAKAGFYFTGFNMEVQCFCCGGRISEWNYGDQVMAKHKTLDPRCPFVLNPTKSGNIPITHKDVTQFHDEIKKKSEPWRSIVKYCTVEARMETFTWPARLDDLARKLAQEGFYFIPTGSMIVCLSCGGHVVWNQDDPVDVFEKHRREFSSTCLGFHNERPIGEINVPYGYDRSVDREEENNREYGIYNHRKPHFEEMMTYESRLRSFEDGWPSNAQKTPHELSEAGFFRNKEANGDAVCCYHCGAGLQGWQREDDVWEEHAKYFPNCDFVRLIKGDDFIKNINFNQMNDLDAIAKERGFLKAPSKNGVTDAEVSKYMEHPFVKEALQMGLDVARVKLCVKERLRASPLAKRVNPFNSVDDLIHGVLNLQMDENHYGNYDDGDSSDFEEFFERAMSSFQSANNFNAMVESRGRASDNPNGIFENFDEMAVRRSGLNLTIVSAPEQRRDSLEIDRRHSSEIVRPDFSEISVFENEEEQKEKTLKEIENEMKEASPSPSASTSGNQDALLCRICMDGEKRIVFLPCGHFISCSGCAATLWECPICRKFIRGTVKAYLS